MHRRALLRKEDSSTAACAAAAGKAERRRAKKALQKAGATAAAKGRTAADPTAAEEPPTTAVSRMNAPDVAHAAAPGPSSDSPATIEHPAGPSQSTCAAALLADTAMPEWQLCALTRVRVTNHSLTPPFTRAQPYTILLLCVSHPHPACHPGDRACWFWRARDGAPGKFMHCDSDQTNWFQLSCRDHAQAKFHGLVATDCVEVY